MYLNNSMLLIPFCLFSYFASCFLPVAEQEYRNRRTSIHDVAKTKEQEFAANQDFAMFLYWIKFGHINELFVF